MKYNMIRIYQAIFLNALIYQAIRHMAQRSLQSDHSPWEEPPTVFCSTWQPLRCGFVWKECPQNPTVINANKNWLVGGWATPLKNMTSSIGMMIYSQYFWENKIDGNQTTTQLIIMFPMNLELRCHPAWLAGTASTWKMVRQNESSKTA